MSSTTYKVTVVFNETSSSSTSTSFSYVAYVLKNGTVSALTVSENGQNLNLTGSEVAGIGPGIFAGFILDIEYVNNLGAYTSLGDFHSTGTSTVTISSNTFKVTNYGANSLPETITNCDGSTSTITAFSLSVGTPTGASIPLVTKIYFDGSTTSDGTTTNSDVTLQVTSFTLAS